MTLEKVNAERSTMINICTTAEKDRSHYFWFT